VAEVGSKSENRGRDGRGGPFNVLGYATVPKLDFAAIATKLKGATYEPEFSPTVNVDIKGCLLRIYSTGKIACFGKTEKQTRVAVEELCRRVRDLGLYIPKRPSIIYASKAYSTSIGKRVRLRKAEFLLKGAEFLSKTGRLTMRLDQPSVFLQIFEDGNIICLGAKTREQSEEAFSKLRKMLRDLNLTEETSMRPNKTDGSKTSSHIVSNNADQKAVPSRYRERDGG